MDHSAKFARYRWFGHRTVEGWAEPQAFDLLKVINDAQAQVLGDVCEIGVHKGKLLIGMQLLNPQATAVAVDLFADQDRNIDGSGYGDLAAFRRNVQRWGDWSAVVTHQGDSTELTPAELLKLGGPFRLFSVDGGHTESTVLSDMYLAEATVADGGVAIGDDVFQARWPGVSVGTLRYLLQGAKLVPFCIGFNKVLFTQPGHTDKYRAALATAYEKRMSVALVHSVYAEHPVVILESTIPVPKGARERLRQSPVARSVYHRLIEPIYK
jgi:hypothetical protein